MAIELYEAAELALRDTVERCRAVLGRVNDGLVRPDEAEGWINEHLLDLLGALDDAFTSAPDPRDDPRGLVERAEQALDDLEELFEASPGMLVRDSLGVRGSRAFLRARVAHADQVVRMVAVVGSWEDTTPALAPLRMRRQAIETFEQAAQLNLRGGFLTRLVRAGLRAFGPRWAVDLAVNYLDRHLVDHDHWDLVLAAMDELAAWAAATELHGIPAEFQRRAVSALIEIAGHPELTQWAVCRVPLHRISMSDRHELSELLADRYEVMPLGWTSESHEEGTVALEVTYLLALEKAASTWPGAAGTAH